MSTHEIYRDKAMMNFALAIRETLDSADIDDGDEGYMSDGECLGWLYEQFKRNLLMYIPDEKLRVHLAEKLL